MGNYIVGVVVAFRIIVLTGGPRGIVPKAASHSLFYPHSPLEMPTIIATASIVPYHLAIPVTLTRIVG